MAGDTIALVLQMIARALAFFMAATFLIMGFYAEDTDSAVLRFGMASLLLVWCAGPFSRREQ